MPYITNDRRRMFDTTINDIVHDLGRIKEYEGQEEDFDPDLAKGDLNYIIYSIAKQYLDKHGHRYRNLNDICGAIYCCNNEIYRRLGVDLEEKAIEKNGDIC